MRMLEIRIRNRVFCKEFNEAIEETGVQIMRGSSLLTYRQTCELARIATDGEHEFPAHVKHFLEDVAEMWDHWNDVEPIEIDYGGGSHYHYLKFVD